MCTSARNACHAAFNQMLGWGWSEISSLGLLLDKSSLPYIALCLPIKQALQKKESWFRITGTEMYEKSGNESRHMNCEEHSPNPPQKILKKLKIHYLARF